MNCYLAAPYAWKERIEKYAAEARAVGVTITSSWLEEPHASTIGLSDLSDDEHAKYALNDLRDIDAADVLVLFAVPKTDPPIPRAGRHVEFGYALAQGLRIIVVGGHENIFHYLGRVKHVDTWDEALKKIIEQSIAINGK